MHPYPHYLVERFWSYVDKDSSPDGCWLWTGHIDSQGYGEFPIPHNPSKNTTSKKQLRIRTHRFAFELRCGPVPEGLLVLHRPPCVTRHCVRHLYVGTQKNNVDDIDLLNRRNHNAVRGENHGNSKYTAAIILAIRQDFAEGLLNQRQIAQKYGIHFKYISQIIRRGVWEHIP